MPFSSKKAQESASRRTWQSGLHEVACRFTARHCLWYASAEVKGCAHACRQTWADNLRLYTLLSKASIRLQADLTGVPPTEQTVVEAQQF